MSFKSIASILLMGGVLMFLGIRPSDLLDHGGNFWEKFSGDSLALFNGDAANRVAKEMRETTGGGAQAYCDAESGGADDESSALEREIKRDRCEAVKKEKVIVLNPEEIRQRWEDRKRNIE
jgi:hypothetical protein